MIANHKGEIPFLVLLLPFVLGTVIGISMAPNVNKSVALGLFSATAILFIILNVVYSRFKIYKASWAGGVLIFFAICMVGWFNAIRYNQLNNNDHFSKIPAQYLLMKINSEPIIKSGILRFTGEVKAVLNNKTVTTTSGMLLIALKDSDATNLYYGDEMLVRAKYNPIDPPFNPAEFNYKRYLGNQNIFYQAFLYPSDYVVPKTQTGDPIITYSLRLRQRLIAKLKQGMHDTTAIAVASTLILGYKADLSNDVLQAYSKTGTVHVLSVSGAHVAIIYVILAWALGFLDRFTYGRLLKAIIIIALIWYYSLLSGFSPAVCRAAVMISMVIAGKAFNRYINTLNILAISAFALLLYDPFFITDVGFQLSYLAVFGLIVLQPVVFKWFIFKNKWANLLWMPISVSIAAQVITFPLSAFYFHQFPVYFLISNLVIIIPTTIIMYSGLLYLLLPQIPIISKALAYILEHTIIIMNKALSVIEYAPYASVNKIWLTIPEYLLLYIIIISVFYFMFDKKRWLIKLALACTLLFCISISCKRIIAFNKNDIAFLNLRKHSGIILKKGSEAVVLTDIKPYDKTYKYSIQPYLDSSKVSKVTVINPTQDVIKPWLAKKSNLIFFFNKRLILFDPLQSISGNLKTDYLYISGNPHIALSQINNNINYETIVVGADNSSQFVDRITKDAKAKKINCSVLKRNKSFIIASN